MYLLYLETDLSYGYYGGLTDDTGGTEYEEIGYEPTKELAMETAKKHINKHFTHTTGKIRKVKEDLWMCEDHCAYGETLYISEEEND